MYGNQDDCENYFCVAILSLRPWEEILQNIPSFTLKKWEREGKKTVQRSNKAISQDYRKT